MGLLKNFVYRVERIRKGERVVVVIVESAPRMDCQEQSINYRKDSFGNEPQQITFRNPLGELVTKLSPIVTESWYVVDRMFGHERLTDHLYDVYKKYNIGDSFP